MTTKGENKFASRITSRLYLNPDFNDITFVIKDGGKVEKVPALKCILATCSPVFDELCFGNSVESGVGVVEIQDCSAAAFKEFLQFFYLDHVKLTMENMEEVFALVRKYQMLECFNAYVKYFYRKLSLNEICWGYQLAIVTGNEPFEKYCERAICNYPIDIFKSKTFIHCNQNVLKRILQLEHLLCDESDVFDACMKWAKFVCRQKELDDNNTDTLKEQLGECFQLIRFNTMPPDVFAAHTAPYPTMFTQEEVADIVKNFSTASRSTLRPRHIPAWDTKNVLSCQRDSSSRKYFIQNPESVWFSANKPLLLGEFYCCPLQHPKGPVKIPYGITINEESVSGLSTKIMYQGSVDITGSRPTKVRLEQPIVIHPLKLYEICLKAPAKARGYVTTCAKWPTEVKLNDKINVFFHQNESVTDCHGLVSRLSFNVCELD